MTLATVAGVSAGAIALVGTGAAAANVALLRRITLPSRPKLVRLSIIDDAVEFDRSPVTEMKGTFGVWVNDGRGHLHVGDILEPASGDKVKRRLLGTYGDVGDVELGRWSGHSFPHASSVGVEFEDVEIETPDGRRSQAWLFQGDRRYWAVHVHGFKSSRASALRGVPALSQAGFMSLVPTYYGESSVTERNTEEGATFGEAELGDIEAAVSFAARNGAEKILLVGWSLGAEVALSLAQRSVSRSKIAGLVLIGPALNWRHALDEAMRRSSLPAVVRHGLLRSLESRLWSRLARMSTPAKFEDHDWIGGDRHAELPTLVIHSRGDTDTFWEDSERFASNNPETVELEEFEPVPHLLEWNTQRPRFESHIKSWVDRLMSRSELQA